MVRTMDKKGFSLLEVLVGLVILSIGLLAIAGMQVTFVRGNFFSKNITEASYVAQDRMEFLNNLPLNSAELQPGNYNDGTQTYSGVVFSRSYSVVSNGGLRTINYVVRWNDGVARSITISTIRAI
jgi:type IV pilus modification protein PilV